MQGCPIACCSEGYCRVGKGTVDHGPGSGVRAGGTVHWQVLPQQQVQGQQQQQGNGQGQVLQNLQGMPCHAGHNFSVGTGQGCRGAGCPSHAPIQGNLHRQDGQFGQNLQKNKKNLQSRNAYKTRGFRADCTVQSQDNLGKVGKVGEMCGMLCTAPLRCDNDLQRSGVDDWNRPDRRTAGSNREGTAGLRIVNPDTRLVAATTPGNTDPGCVRAFPVDSRFCCCRSSRVRPLYGLTLHGTPCCMPSVNHLTVLE